LQFRRGGLHAEGQLVTGGATVDLRIADQFGAFAIQVGKGVEAGTADCARQAGRVGEIGDGLAARAKENARMRRAKKAARPKRRRAAGAAAAGQHHIAG
jgi:hypothetical protein